MRQNARRDEDFDKPDSQIAAEFASGEKWTEYKNNVLEGIVKDKKAWRNDVLGSCFINGPASGVVVRCVYLIVTYIRAAVIFCFEAF
jgi:hypothetical protein